MRTEELAMKLQLPLQAGLILLLSAAPGAACDPEEMINELRAQCREAVTSAVTLIDPIKPALSGPERNSVEAKVKEATALCDGDKYTEGYTLTVKLARFVGHIEARAGVAPAL
jgi:hypothetical protein